MPLDTARIITEAEYNAIWEEANACGEVLWQWNDVEQRRAIPKRLGQGEEWIIDLHPGLSIHIATYQYWRPLCLDYHYNGEGMLLSNFYLAGDRRMINPGIQLEEDREETAGETCLCYIKEVRSIEYFPAEQIHKSVGIKTDLERLKSFGMNWDNTSSLLRSLIEGKSAKNFHQSLNQSTPAMQQTLQQMLNCPYHGVIKRMYLESKVLELLVLQFHQLAGQNSYNTIPNFRPTDIERLHLAKEILQRDLDGPPSLLDLARQVGLNDYKLKRGFRYLFGTTVFGYLQTCRIKQAQELLCDRELSIAEIAHRVGYASASRFCDAFKRHMNMTPSAYRRRRI
ncbi:transcriptional regulator, AraC family [Gloeocapsa sp. PCC 7428]|uniref:AraC family transcriptional regulator n=1 Tax=Gloeocapsa sp. PCC 7428 TaxID=1173026 RepID=UPI0002A5D902|nr:helix-turn-helix domain-containing protein [Gloeocapsa sp. PCC 7428]AFZ30907.1 transcriptional regulator, AraC family [Gloeocapsa sp. PCC 7428]